MAIESGTVNDEISHPKRGDLLRLTSLRALAAFLVFAYHLDHDGVIHARAFLHGDTGVVFFFILSGFVLAWSTPTSMRPAEFYRRRFARIYPSHLVMLIAAVLLPVVTVSVTTGGTLASLFLVQAWSPHAPILYGLNAVAWTLSCEAFFYLVFPFVFRQLQAWSPARRWSLALAWFAGEAIVAAASTHFDQLQTVGYANPLIRFAEFLLGMVAAIEIRRGWRLRPSLGALIVFAGVLAISLFPTSRPLPNVYLAPVYFAIILFAVHRDLGHGADWLSGRWLVYAGQVSFAFYLVHELVMVNLLHETGHRGWLVALESLVLSAIAAVALHHLVEIPCQRLIRRVRMPVWAARPRLARTPARHEGNHREQRQDGSHRSEAIR
jgi:peptidoglycan/LPS O-acetylase OafA/YrhL